MALEAKDWEQVKKGAEAQIRDATINLYIGQNVLEMANAHLKEADDILKGKKGKEKKDERIEYAG